MHEFTFGCKSVVAIHGYVLRYRLVVTQNLVTPALAGWRLRSTGRATERARVATINTISTVLHRLNGCSLGFWRGNVICSALVIWICCVIATCCCCVWQGTCFCCVIATCCCCVWQGTCLRRARRPLAPRRPLALVAVVGGVRGGVCCVLVSEWAVLCVLRCCKRCLCCRTCGCVNLQSGLSQLAFWRQGGRACLCLQEAPYSQVPRRKFLQSSCESLLRAFGLET